MLFTNTGTSATASNINNVVDDGFAGTIGALEYDNDTGAHTTLIAPGRTLRITGALMAATGPGDSFFTATANTITGPTGSVVVANSNEDLIVNGGYGTALDLGGLGQFAANVSHVRVGARTNDFEFPVPFVGALVLARISTIVASGSDPAILVSGGGTLDVNLTGRGFLLMGQTNSIFADTITAGLGYQNGDTTCLSFNPAFSNSAAVFRGRDGLSRVGTFAVADGQTGFHGDGTVLVDFSLGTVDLQADTLTVSRFGTNSFAFSDDSSRGTLSFSKGTIDVNTLQLGLSVWDASNDAVGTANVLGAAKLLVNGAIEMGVCPSQTYTTTRGLLNIAGGTVIASMINANYPTTGNTITMTNGTLIVSNTMGPGITAFSMTNSTLQLPAVNGPSAFVTNLVTGGVSNVINVASLEWLSSFPTQLALVKYSGTIAGAGFNFGLGGLPSGTHAYSGYLTNNTANSSIDLVLLSFSPSRPSLGGRILNGKFDLSLSGDPGRKVEILGSTNLVDWDSLSVLTNTTGNLTFEDPATNSARRFYRARQSQ